ncbi:helix-turn-helix transcriptional regulator [Lysinibacillus agricola]|uniref:Helix-turn-helix transcriptional regulator n=1 Tax=Lysinibacillus agricola TaxID=2590012 RepID=A0ABX7AMU8_9BACI|nr:MULTISPECIES: helix-turn-helix transcriptional regulator [Lysinibacillus]KOS61490.1 hypothetical protein AN161_18030 [Lysinibacillus sp. FJAT-14222]QQP10822.1 helix-turn-helix transcriptional regulator [Lysinibacillus agricola]
MSNNKNVDSREFYYLSPIIGRSIKVFRKSNKLTMEEVSNRTGYSAQAISLCERAKRMPSSDLLLKLAAVYQVSEEELFRLREETIIDTVQTYGEKSPVSIRNEFDTIMNTKYSKNTHPSNRSQNDRISLGDGEYATDEELILAKAFIITLRSIKK